jgi:hypothetical protein
MTLSWLWIREKDFWRMIQVGFIDAIRLKGYNTGYVWGCSKANGLKVTSCNGND